MHTGTTSSAAAAQPKGMDVRDSTFGAFCAALPAPTPTSTPAQRLIAHAKASCTVDGYTSWPAYADRLERLVVSLMDAPGVGGRL